MLRSSLALNLNVLQLYLGRNNITHYYQIATNFLHPPQPTPPPQFHSDSDHDKVVTEDICIESIECIELLTCKESLCAFFWQANLPFNVYLYWKTIIVCDLTVSSTSNTTSCKLLRKRLF